MAAQEVFKRIEKKYRVSSYQYHALRKLLADLVQPDMYGETSVRNIYYDTDDFRLIRASLEKPIYKEKLRLRSYGSPMDDSTVFVELKKKFKGVVYKRRVPMNYGDALRYLNEGEVCDQNWTAEEEQIFGEINWFRERNAVLEPRMVITYDRVALIGVDDPELRITFDWNIRWQTDRMELQSEPSGSVLLNPGEYLMEIKIANAMPLSLTRILSGLHIFPDSFSKYGSGYTEMCSRSGTDLSLPWMTDRVPAF